MTIEQIIFCVCIAGFFFVGGILVGEAGPVDHDIHEVAK